MALHRISNASSNGAARATRLDGDITPAELPPGRVRFSDELGRETALVARADASRGEAGDVTKSPRAGGVASNERDDVENGAEHAVASNEHRDAAPDGSSQEHEAAPPKSSDGNPSISKAAPAATKTKATRSRSGAERPAAAAPEGDDEISLALTQLGLAIQPPPAPPPAPPPQLDPSGTRIVAGESLTAAASATESTNAAAEAEAIATTQTVAGPGNAEASEVTHALLSGLEKSAARDADSDPKLASTSVAKESGAALALLGIAASHGVTAAARAPGVEAAAAKPAAAVEPSAANAADALPRVALAELPRALPALADELAPRIRFGRRGANWEVELRLDPPELGSLRIRFELHGDSIRGAIHCEPRVERLLGPVLKDLEEEMGRQGGNASFDLARQERDGERGSSSSRPWRAEPFAAAAAAPLAPAERTDPSRLVDVTA